MLAEIWSEALGLDRVGVEDDFFDLGGHSLLATQVVARIRKQLRRDLPLHTLFESPTVALLASALESCGEPAGTGDLPEIVAHPEHITEPFPLTDVQRAYWIGRSGAFELGNISTHMYVEFEADGIDLDRLERTWNRIVARHDMLRAIVRTDGSQQILNSPPAYCIECEDLRNCAPEERAHALEAIRTRMSHEMHDASRWPLFEIRTSMLDGGRTRIHFSCDVLMVDAWSFQILQREFATLYGLPTYHLAPLEFRFVTT